MASNSIDSPAFWATDASKGDEGANITDALFAITEALVGIATQLKYLGNGNAGTTMGAIEGHAVHLGEKLETIGQEISGGLHAIASSIEYTIPPDQKAL